MAVTKHSIPICVRRFGSSCGIFGVVRHQRRRQSKALAPTGLFHQAPVFAAEEAGGLALQHGLRRKESIAGGPFTSDRQMSLFAYDHGQKGTQSRNSPLTYSEAEDVVGGCC
jgi:hypothetical protein